MYESAGENDALPLVAGGARRGAGLKPRSPRDATDERLAAPRHAPRRRQSARADMHPLRTCLIVGMPWFAYSIFNTVFTDVREAYMKSMGISSVSPRFLPGIVSFFLGPILGAASDRSLSKWGRRNVFMLAGTSCMALFGLLFGAANVLFPDLTGITNLVLVLLCVGVLLFNIGLRARIMDEVPIEYQMHAQLALAMWGGIGGILGALLFSNTTSVVVFASSISGRDILIAFSASLAAMIVTALISIPLRPEHPQDRPPFQPPLERLVRDVWEEIVYAPMRFRLLCVVNFVLCFAWKSFQDEIFNWWGGNVYNGCKHDGCDDDAQSEFKKGLDMANTALISQNGLQAIMCFALLFLSPRVPNASYLKKASVGGLAIGTCALVVAVAVDDTWIALTFAGFVVTAFYQAVVSIFPYAVVGILGKEIQTSAHGFNNNGLYIGVLMLFASASELTVQIYGTEDMAPLGTGNYLALPCILFGVGVACTAGFSFSFKSAAPVVL